MSKQKSRWCDKCQEFTAHRKREVVLAEVTLPNGDRYGAVTDAWECQSCQLQTIIKPEEARQ